MSLAKAISNRIQSEPIEIKVGDETYTYRVKKFSIAQNDEYNKIKKRLMNLISMKQMRLIEVKVSKMDENLTEEELLNNLTEEQAKVLIDSQLIESESILKYLLENGIGRNNFDEEEFDKLTESTLKALLQDVELANEISKEVERFNNPFFKSQKSMK